jgi:hypothetical protein
VRKYRWRKSGELRETGLAGTLHAAPSPVRLWSRDLVPPLRPRHIIPWLRQRRDALVMPYPEHSADNHIDWHGGGVYRTGGQPDPLCAVHIGQPLSAVPADPAVEDSPAIFAGALRNGFPHTIAEGLGRLWAIGRVTPGLPLAYVTPHRNLRGGGRKVIAAILAAHGLYNPVTTVTVPTRFRRLWMPADLAPALTGNRSHSVLRNFMAARRLPHPSPVGPRLFISRAGMPVNKARFLCEDVLERALAAEGYEPFRPEEHAMPAQLAAFAQAREVIISETGALHLIALYVPADARIAVLLRRPVILPSIGAALGSFSSRALTLVSAVSEFFVEDQDGRLNTAAGVPALDWPRLWAGLQAAGFIADAGRMPLPDPGALAAERAAATAGRTVTLTLPGAGDPPADRTPPKEGPSR